MLSQGPSVTRKLKACKGVTLETQVTMVLARRAQADESAEGEARAGDRGVHRSWGLHPELYDGARRGAC